ncbi:MAG TPA: PBP1A family penicillin-binding protein, partial [Polyangia bacterium]|nr:PBP1A family penicillin-binding protein [Polyangia bacterium]
MVGAATATGAGVWVYRKYESDLPQNLNAVTDYRPLRASQIFSADGEMIGEFFVEKRVLVPIEEVPDVVKKAFVAAEDVRFYKHHGVDYQGILRAAWTNLRARQVVQGGSSITQQVAKLLLVGHERSLKRKLREALLATRIERSLTKDQILGIYLNHVYLGHGSYGVVAAAKAYFGKSLGDLTAAEAAMLAALPKSPSRITPFNNFARAQERQRYVLDQMQEAGFLTAAQAQAARREPLALVAERRTLTNVAAPYFVETVRRAIVERYGEEDLLEKGLRIETTLSMRDQRAAETAVRRGLEDLSRRLGFAGPIAHAEAADRARLTSGRPRPLGPTGFEVDDAEQSGPLVALPEPQAALVDATHPGARLRDPVARYVTGEAQAALRRAARAKAPPAFPTDPDTTYAAVVTATGKGVMVASGGLTVRLEPTDEARVLAWQGAEGARVGPGDVLAVQFRNNEAAPPGRRAPKPTAVLATTPPVQGALVALDPHTGKLLAMVGGYDYAASQFNRATQAHRQIGSAIKPFIYAASIDQGMTPLTIKWDAPVKFKTASGVWAPHNYKPEYLGAITLRTALAKSINTVAAQLVAQIGVDRVVEEMRGLGITSPLPHGLSLALGTADLGLEETAYALASFPAGGKLVRPLTILRVTDGDGRVLEEQAATPPQEQRLSPETAYVVTDMMKGVIEVGTGKKAQALGRPVAGKTGTSTNYRDAWFYGFTPDLLCGVWVGRDDFKPVAHDATGGQVALPIWLDFMRTATKGQPVRDFPMPPGVVLARANPETGEPAAPNKPKSRLIPFKRG